MMPESRSLATITGDPLRPGKSSSPLPSRSKAYNAFVDFYAASDHIGLNGINKRGAGTKGSAAIELQVVSIYSWHKFATAKLIHKILDN
jgi:hypothetical protein